jgi:hypothetical protein
LKITGACGMIPCERLPKGGRENDKQKSTISFPEKVISKISVYILCPEENYDIMGIN